jgi:2-polyprenyl-6-methoxyphenol hydroxylase-like FAD-dependent oxidoreductase
MTIPEHSQCVIAGGGPAGMTLGLLLARAGVRVTVLEKHRDFLRDFRGDTIHPSTMEILHELGLLERFLRLPHEKVSRLSGQFGDLSIPFADFSHLPVQAPFIAMMPQWDFLDFLADEGRRYPGFNLTMSMEAIDLIEEGGRVVGVRAKAEGGGEFDVRGDLVVAADGRHSVLRRRAGLAVRDLGAPMDVLWFRLSRQPGDTAETMGRFDPGAIMVMINRGTYWQCAKVIPKGGIDEVKAKGLPAFKAGLAKSLPFSADRADEIGSWDDVKLLTVAVDRLEQWHRPGLLCIGDAAHAMSPIGGVGVNLAVQDAVAAANVLAAPLREGRAEPHHLAAIQKRRLWPTRVVQWMQLAIQNNVIAPTLSASAPRKPPLPVRLLAGYPILRRLPARLVGLGIRPEHVSDEIRRVDSARS